MPLSAIAHQLGIDLYVVAIGDNLNDISMLERGYPAMNNATDVKHIAKYVTDTNENSGVGKAIMKNIKRRK